MKDVEKVARDNYDVTFNELLVEALREVPGVRRSLEDQSLLESVGWLFGHGSLDELRDLGVPDAVGVLVRDVAPTTSDYLTYHLLRGRHPLAKVVWLCSVIVRVRLGKATKNEVVKYALPLAANTYPALVEWFAEETAKVLD